MIKFYAIATLIIVAISPFTSYANELQVDYKTFYSHVRKLSGEDTQALQFAFGFMNIHTKKLCTINEARISTQKVQMPITVTPENRFTIPKEKALRLADAKVILNLEEANNICDISVQLETKPEYLKTQYPESELQFLYEQYQAFFNEMGSFMSFMMPQVNGLTIHFEDKTLNRALSNGMRIQDGLLTLASEDFKMIDRINLPEAPLRITAKTTKS